MTKLDKHDIQLLLSSLFTFSSEVEADETMRPTRKAMMLSDITCLVQKLKSMAV